jgi:hypothetical protein
MDELGIEIQVLYPTFFLSPVVQDAARERALCKSYNRWAGDLWRQGKGYGAVVWGHVNSKSRFAIQVPAPWCEVKSKALADLGFILCTLKPHDKRHETT